MRTVQPPLFTPETEWVMPDELKDLTQYKEIAVDLETNDPQLTTLGAGNVVGRGHSCRCRFGCRRLVRLFSNRS